MPKVTIELPDAIMSVLDDQPAADPAREGLEDILEARDKGPFVPVPDDLVERVMEKALKNAQAQKTHV